MNYLFLGLLCDKEKEKEYISKARTGVQGAVNTFQWNLLDGFAENGASVTVLNTMPVGCYPKQYRQLFFKGNRWQYGTLPCREIGFVNLPVIKQAMRKHGYIKQVKEWIKNTKGEKTVIAYSLYVPFLQALAYVKKHYPQVKVSVIVTDLPGKYGFYQKTNQRRTLKQWYDNRAMKLLDAVDCFVLLTKQMASPLGVGARPYVVVEGICNSKCGTRAPAPISEKAVLYTGSLDKVFGVLELVSAFMQTTNPDYRLWICGKNGAEEEIRRLAKQDTRIVYKGYLSKEEVYALQAQASLLVNPRKNDGEYTKYSFPSKTMEYMISGTPVLMHKLDGIPDEYGSYVYYINGNTTDALASSIQAVLSLPWEVRHAKAMQAQDFVMRFKNGAVQAKRILDMLEK